MSTHTTSNPPPPWVADRGDGRGLGRRGPGAADHHARPAALIRAFEEYVLELAGQGPHPRPGALQHRAGGRRGRLGAAADESTDSVNGSHRGHHQFLAKALNHVAPKGIDPRDDLPDDVRDRAAPHAGRDLRAGPRLLPRARRLDAPAVARGRRDGHQRDRRRRCAAGRGLRVGTPALGHRRRRGHLLRRRRGQHRIRAGDLQPRGRRGSSRSASSSRTTTTRCRRRSRRPPAKPGSRGAGRDSASPAGGSTAWTHLPCTWRWPRRRPHASWRWPDGHRGRHLPLLPPERRVRRQRIRLPQQGRGALLA